MKARIIHTSFYDSERILSLSSQSRWLFMYYLTCKGIGLTGAFKWSNMKTQFETGLTSKQINDAKKELSENNLVHFYEEWIVVPQTEEKTGYNKGAKTSVAYSKEFESLPDEVKSILSNNEYPMDTLLVNEDRVSPLSDTPRNHKPETINKKTKGGVGEKTKQAQELIDLFNLEFQRNYRLTSKRKDLIEHRLRTFEFHQLQDAVKKLARDPFYSGKNQRGWVADPDYLFRNDENIDKALNLEVSIKNKRKSLEDLMKEEA